MPVEAPHPLTCKEGRRTHLADESALEAFTCAICYEVICDPVATTCDHVFCRTCLQKWLDTSRTPKCPLDNLHIMARMKLPPPSFLVEYNILQVKCMYATFGCDRVCAQSDVMGHEEDCGYKWARCELCMAYYGTWLAVEDHEDDHCPNRMETCRMCGEKIVARSMDAHKYGCGLEKTICECGRRVTRGDLSRHQAHECRCTVLVCVHCSETMPPPDAAKHTCKVPATIKIPDGIYRMQKVKNGGKKKKRRGEEEEEGEGEGEENGERGGETGEWEEMEDEGEKLGAQVSKYIRELELNLKKKTKDCKRLSRNVAEARAENEFLDDQLQELCETVVVLRKKLKKRQEATENMENTEPFNEREPQNQAPKQEHDLEPMGGMRWRSGVASVTLCPETLLMSFLIGVAMVMLWHLPYGWFLVMGLVAVLLPSRLTLEDGWLVIG